MTAEEALDKINHNLHYIIEKDTRTMTNPETEDELYYKGIYDCIKVVEKYTKTSNSITILGEEICGKYQQ